MWPRRQSQWVVGSSLLALALCFGGLYLLWLRDQKIAEENALMENLQAGALALACGVLLFPLFRAEVASERFIYWSLVLILLSMFLREVDVESLGLPNWLVWWGSGTGRNLLIGCYFLVTAAALATYWNHWYATLRAFILSTTSLMFSLGGALYVSSLPFDKRVSGLAADTNRFCEEAVECGATLIFLIAAGWAVFWSFRVRAVHRATLISLSPSAKDDGDAKDLRKSA